MFCVLSVKERNKTLFERLFGRFLVDEYSVKTVPVFKGAPFFSLNITTGKREINWENVIFSVGKCAARLLLNGDIQLPDDMNIAVFKSQLLYSKMMENTFIHIFENNKKELYPISITDENADHTEFVKQISLYASSMSIFTLNKEKYIEICEEITDETGMCPILKNAFEDAYIKINSNNLTMTIQGENENVNISSGVDFTVEQIYKNLLPDFVNKYDFYSALYELCGVFSIGESIFDTIMVNNEKKRVQDIHFS